MVEKRKYNRFQIFQMIQMSVGGREEYISCEGINISRAGMLVKTSIDIDSSARFYLLFEVPLPSGKYEIRCEGLPAHVHKVEDGYEVGVSFSDLGEDEEKILEQYIQALEKKE
jgi:c-di-GMP-binding flagellar brake protein YcgR